MTHAWKIGLLTSAALWALPVAAQTGTTAEAAPTAASDEGSAIDEIVVTAQKRSESLQRVPLSISALSGDALANRAIDSLTSLATSIPSMTFGS